MIRQGTSCDISVVIATYNNCHSLRRTLESLAGQKDVAAHCRYEIVIVDNRSTDQTRHVVEDMQNILGERLRYVYESRAGTAHARNRGIREAAGGIIAFTDDDCVLDEKWLATIERAFQKEDVDVIQGRIHLATSMPAGSPVPESMMRQRMAHVDYGSDDMILDAQDIVTANAAFRRNVFQRVGEFNPYDAFRSNEDSELSGRLKSSGVRRKYVADMVVEHHFAVDRLSVKKVLRQAFYWGRSGFYFDHQTVGRWRYAFYHSRRCAQYLGAALVACLKHNPQERFLQQCKAHTAAGRIYECLRGHPPQKVMTK